MCEYLWRHVCTYQTTIILLSIGLIPSHMSDNVRQTNGEYGGRTVKSTILTGTQGSSKDSCFTRQQEATPMVDRRFTQLRSSLTAITS